MEFEVDRLDEQKEKQEKRGRTGFVIQYKYIELLSLLSDEERSEFIMALYEYDLTGELPELSKRVRAIIKAIKYDIDKTRDVWERNNKNCRIKHSSVADNAEACGPQESSGSKESSANDNAGQKDAHSGFVPPTAAEAKEFAEANNIETDTESFIDYYESNGWMIGGNKMNNWKAALKRWARNAVNFKSKDRDKPGFEQREFNAGEEKKRRVMEMLKEGERIAALKEQGG